MKDILLLTGLVMLAVCGSALDSTGLLGYIAAGGVLAGLGLMWVGVKMESCKAEEDKQCLSRKT